MRPTFVRKPCRSMLEALMMPKRGETMFLARISHDALELLASVDKLHPFIMAPYPYAGLDWRGCANILFIDDEPPNDKGNIIVLFKFIVTCYLTCFY